MDLQSKVCGQNYHSFSPFPIIQRKYTDPVWTPSGEDIRTSIDRIDSVFDGRADLVLALRDEGGKGGFRSSMPKPQGLPLRFPNQVAHWKERLCKW